MAAGEELATLIQREIPEGRESLKGNYANLENVAKYCEDNYQRASASEKAQALQETKNYTTHSLASVAYQINNLATNFLKLLDLQQSQLTDMESSVNHLNQFVMIHKEKVARREIGILTSTRNVPRSLGMKNGIIYPEQTERPIKYIRKSIDYSALDDIGHGVKSASTPRTTRSPSISSTHSNSSNPPNPHQAPTTKPPTPPVNRVGSGGTIGRAAGGHYRTPVPAVVPPVAPAQAPATHPPPGNFPQYSQSSRSSVSSAGSYSPSSTLVMGAVHSPPMSGMGHPAAPGPGYGPSPTASHNMPRPQAPLMHPDVMAYARHGSPSGRAHSGWMESSTMSLPPPPPEDDLLDPGLGSQASPHFPPPPVTEMPGPGHFDFNQAPAPAPPAEYADGPPSGPHIPAGPDDTYGTVHGNDDPYAATGPHFLAQTTSWIPKHYLEKVVAIYDYVKSKEDELSFSENAVIYVIHKNDDGWWEGVMDGQTGLFPYNYVEPCM